MNKKRSSANLKTNINVITIGFLPGMSAILLYTFSGCYFTAENAVTQEDHLSPGASITVDTNSLRAEEAVWVAPDTNTIPNSPAGKQIRYGRELIISTSKFLGPKGSVAAISNGMNCQNCHNEAGTKAFGLNYSAVATTYPQYRDRSDSWTSIAMRINGCFERSLNGKSLDSTSHEMTAMIAYIKWLGKGVERGLKPPGAGVEKLLFLDRAADPQKGKIVFLNTCQSCHGKDGGGLMNAEGNGYEYPPLWGKNSYNDGAGLYRLANFAGFVKNNMPLGVNYRDAVLTDAQAWDVAAYVNSKPRPHKDQSKDWKNLAKKPIDFPFGPYADQFSEYQHKLGPFKPIETSRKLNHTFK